MWFGVGMREEDMECYKNPSHKQRKFECERGSVRKMSDGECFWKAVPASNQ